MNIKLARVYSIGIENYHWIMEEIAKIGILLII